jgi:anthraniloyl-CoA monooxygenase
MRVTIIGGGPGGLYTAILLRRARPDVEVTVLERNAPDDTFGFGVVFSAATLAELEDADPVSYQRMSSAWARWDPVEVRYRGEVLRAGGNRFAAISRHVLLHLLQERAVELGADLRFHTEVDDPDRYADADLVVAADGRNSVTRSRHEAAFGPTTKVEGSTFIWLGTDKVFDAFTFIFAETEHGPFQAHIYPFSDDRSTFIVECTREVWRAAGLDATDPSTLAPGDNDEHTIAFLQELFADHLDGHQLLGNNSRWLDWTTIRNRRWRHGNIVLLGDAAHTAHFSIGSGTKLAMEDAISLAGAVARSDDLDRAIDTYEAERRPMVDRVQEAARESLAWFDRYPRYLGAAAGMGGAGEGFDPPTFAYSLLTRSSRVDHDNLRRRDPGLVLALDRWFAERAGDGHAQAQLLPAPPALTPVEVGPQRLANRAVLAVDDPQDADDGTPTSRWQAAVRSAVTGGAGLVVVTRLAVSAEGRATPVDPGLYRDDHAQAWRDLLEESVGGGSAGQQAAVAAQLTHAGPRASMRPRSQGLDRPLRQGGWERLAASPIPYVPTSPPPRPLDDGLLERVVAEHVAAAEAAASAGFDVLELDAAQGGLLASFLSPLTNRRDDAWGGEVASRLIVPLSVLDAVREAWPTDRPLSVRFSASDRAPGGLSPDDAVTIAQGFVDHGADLVHVVSGQTTTTHRGDYDRWFNARESDLVRNGAGVTTLVSGGVRSLFDVDHVVLGGWADLCVVGPLPDEPAWLAGRRDPDGRGA